VIQGGIHGTERRRGLNGTAGDVQDDEFNVDVRYTSSGLLALANSGVDRNDCQFFVTSEPTRWLDYSYTILGKLVAGTASGDARERANHASNKPLYPPIMIRWKSSQRRVCLVIAQSGPGATAAGTPVSVAASDNSVVTLIGSDGTASTRSTSRWPTTRRPPGSPCFRYEPCRRLYDHEPAGHVPDPGGQGDAGVQLAYGRWHPTNTPNLQCSAAADGSASATATPRNTVGVYDSLSAYGG